MASEQERVLALDLGVLPEPGAPMPLLAHGSDDCVIVFEARPGSDGTRTTGIAEITGCLVCQFGYPNDEALAGHPLSQIGLGPYAMYEVLGSGWAARLNSQNQVSFPTSTLPPKRHFIITFHDETFECLADGMKARTTSESPRNVFARLAQSI